MPVDPRRRSALEQIQAELEATGRALISFVASARGSVLIEDLRTTIGGSATEIVWRALFADCLRVIHSAAMADGVIEDRELEALGDIIVAAARHYATGPRSQYAELSVVDVESARGFLDRYAADRGPLGRGARRRWPGLTLCRCAAELGDREAVPRYIKAMTLMIDEARRVGGVSEAGPGRATTDELDELRRILTSDAKAMMQGVDRRAEAFVGPCHVFSAVQQASSIFENDPFDVEAVHRGARTSFEELVAQATMRPYIPDLGRMLLVLGESGAGKTHLLRGFRRHVHERNRGFVVYAQLHASTEDYHRYLLCHLVDSLSRRYSEQSGKTGLRELASGLMRLAPPPLRARLDDLANDDWEGPGSLADHVEELAGQLVRIDELSGFDLDLLRVLVYALHADPRTASSVYRYMRCDPMSAHDRRWIGDVMPRTREHDPGRMIRDLARFAWATERALVLMVDQVELAGFDGGSTKILSRAVDALDRIVSDCPSAVAVVACLSDLYRAAQPELTRSALDRLEKAPPPAELQINRSYAEIEAVVSRRLTRLFAEYGTVHRPEQPVYPIPESELRQLDNRRLRDVLEWCHEFQTRCAAAGGILCGDEQSAMGGRGREQDLDAIAAAWSEANQATSLELPDEPEDILSVVASAANAYVDELGLTLVAPPHKNGVLRLQMRRGDDCAELAIAVVNQSFRGGAFTSRIEALRRKAKGAVPIAVRTHEFPRGPACDKAMGQLGSMRGRGAILDASTLRALVAFQQFQPQYADDRVMAWKLRDRPISSLPAVIDIFDFERSRIERAVERGPRAPRASSEPAAGEAADDEPAGDGKTASPSLEDEPTVASRAAAPSIRSSVSRSRPASEPMAEQAVLESASTSRPVATVNEERVGADERTTVRPSGSRVAATPSSSSGRWPRAVCEPAASEQASSIAASSSRSAIAATADWPTAEWPSGARGAAAPSAGSGRWPRVASELAASERANSELAVGRGIATTAGSGDSRTERAVASRGSALPVSGSGRWPRAATERAATDPMASEPAVPELVAAEADSSSRSPGRKASGARSASTIEAPADTVIAETAVPKENRRPTAPSRVAAEPVLPEIPSPRRPERSVERPTPRPAAAPGRQIRIGNSTAFDPEPIALEPAALLRHVAIVDGAGGGRVAAALNLVEQVVERAVPAIVIDRTGEMTGYARPEWWEHSADPVRARQLAERVEVRLFTPGIRNGRPLSVALIPDLSRVPRAEHERTMVLAAGAVAAMLPAGPGVDDAGRLAALTQAIGLLARRPSPAGLVELSALVEGGADDGGAGGDPALRQRLANDLAALMGNADVFTHGAEPLTAATLVGPGAAGRVPLAIVHTGFLGEGPRLRAWMAQLIGALDRELASTAGKTLQAVVVLDGAELLLPAGAGKGAAKEPLQELLQRAGNAGVGLVLASARPGELDYRRCASIETWLVGRTDEPTLERMKPLFERRPLGHRNPLRLEAGRSVMLHDGGARDVERAPPLLRIERLAETELKRLAARTHPRERDAAAPRRADAPGEEPVPQLQPVR